MMIAGALWFGHALMIPQVGNERMTLALEWTGQDAYRNEPLREWLVADEVAGKVRSGGGLTFATIDGAGHMVCFSPYRPLRHRFTSVAFCLRLRTTSRCSRSSWQTAG